MGGSLKDKIESLRRQDTDLEEAQRQAEENYRLLLQDQRELVCRLSMQGVLTFVNDAYCRYLGKTREELLGTSPMASIPDEDLAMIAESASRMSQGTPTAQVEHRILYPGGEVRWLSWIDRLLFDSDGKVTGVQSVGLDVTDRKRAEEQARRSEDLARLLEEQRLELSTPLMPIADGVLVMPLIGRVDEKRAQRVLETLLHGVVASAAETVLLDVTGVTLLDAQVAEALVRAAKAVSLLGARTVLTGIQPHVAQTLVTMGLDVTGVITRSSLKEGIAWAMQGRACRSGRGR